MSNLVWTPFQEKIFSYLWYLRSADMALVANLTEMPIEECHIKREQFPDRLPVELRHSILLDQVAMNILKKASRKDFCTSVGYLSCFGLESIEKVYVVWQTTYVQFERSWNNTDLRTLKWAMTCDQSIISSLELWRKIADLFLDRTPDQCKKAYEIFRKNLAAITNVKEVLWIKKDLELLKTHVDKDQKLLESVDWPLIARKFPNKTVYECMEAHKQYEDYLARKKAAKILMQLRY
jgi:hypothetical protein